LWCPDEAATVEAGVRLICPDRPGIGRSDPKPRRTFADWTADVVELADQLEIGKFAVVGYSAGAPYASACAALIPDRLTAAGIACCRFANWSWEERPGVEATWSSQDRAEFELTRADPDAGAALAAANFAPYVAELTEHPEVLHDDLGQAEGDRWFFEDPDRVEAFDAFIREAWRQGVDVLAWELNGVYQPWGFRLAEISMPIHVWHGDQDPWVQRVDIDVIVSMIPNASLVLWPDSGHLGFAKHWGEILTTLTAS
jgi:pimeloyl-ACP methyl ester carboxylesterase